MSLCIMIEMSNTSSLKHSENRSTHLFKDYKTFIWSANKNEYYLLRIVLSQLPSNCMLHTQVYKHVTIALIKTSIHTVLC